MLKRADIEEVRKDGEFIDCYLSCDAGEASYILKGAGFWCEDMQKLSNDDYTAFDVYRKLNNGPVRFEGLGDSYVDCMNIPFEEDLRLRTALGKPQLALQSKIRIYFKSDKFLQTFLKYCLEHVHDVAFVNPINNKSCVEIGGFPSI